MHRLLSGSRESGAVTGCLHVSSDRHNTPRGAERDV